jgi:hypothetical protein
VLSRELKPIFGLVVLLAWPCVGLGGRAEAGFALGRTPKLPGRSAEAPGFELRLVITGETTAEVEQTSSSSGIRIETPTHSPADSSRLPFLPRDLLLFFADALSNGTSSAGTGSVVSGAASSLPFILPSGLLGPGVDQSGLLLLADEHLSPSPFASRLFRPPR